MKAVAVTVGIVLLIAVACLLAGAKTFVDSCQGGNGIGATNESDFMCSDCTKLAKGR